MCNLDFLNSIINLSLLLQEKEATAKNAVNTDAFNRQEKTKTKDELWSKKLIFHLTTDKKHKLLSGMFVIY